MKPLLETTADASGERAARRRNGLTLASAWTLPVLHLSALQQVERVGDHRVEDLVSDGELRLEPLQQQR